MKYNERRVIDLTAVQVTKCASVGPIDAALSGNPLRLDGRMCDKVVCRTLEDTSHLMKVCTLSLPANRPNNWLIRGIQ